MHFNKDGIVVDQMREDSCHRRIFDNIYNLACRISSHNVISEIIMSAVLRNLMMSDVLNLLHINEISMLIRID